MDSNVVMICCTVVAVSSIIGRSCVFYRRRAQEPRQSDDLPQGSTQTNAARRQVPKLRKVVTSGFDTIFTRNEVGSKWSRKNWALVRDEQDEELTE